MKTWMKVGDRHPENTNRETRQQRIRLVIKKKEFTLQTSTGKVTL